MVRLTDHLNMTLAVDWDLKPNKKTINNKSYVKLSYDRSISYPSVFTCVLGTQRNYLIEKLLLSTHNICFGLEIRKLLFERSQI